MAFGHRLLVDFELAAEPNWQSSGLLGWNVESGQFDLLCLS